jgi:hypothetical protein
MGEIIDWLISTPLGTGAVVGGLVIIFVIVAFMSERKTRKLYPDRARRGTKAVAKAKKKKAAAKAEALEATEEIEKPKKTKVKKKKE